ncbi:MAG: sodium-dependent transporter, partial [Longicatena sp.]
KFPIIVFFYVAYILPFVGLFIFFQGYVEKFAFPINYILPTILVLIVAYIPFQAWRFHKNPKK